MTYGLRAAVSLVAVMIGLVGAMVQAADDAATTTATGKSLTDRDPNPIATINKLIAKGWEDNSIKPAELATEGEWVRRVYLDVLGRIPTHDESQDFVASKSKTKKADLINELLNSEKYVEEYARNWTNIWSNMLIGRAQDENSMANKEGMQQYLRRTLLRNTPYNKMVYELVTANGNSRPGAEDYNGAVNFILNDIQTDVPPNERTTRVTANVARLFLGLQVQCTQCHNHPFNDWKQDQFWSFDSFFRQVRWTGGRMAPGSLTDGDFAGESGDVKEADIFYELRNGLLKVAYPTFVDGTKIDPTGYVSEINRRQELGKLIIKSEYMPKALVNRYWGHFMGYGFTKPVDDMGPHNRASNPELLESLGNSFSYTYDVKELIRWLVLSDPYALSSKITSKNQVDDPELGETPKFSRFYLRQMRAEELYNSLIVATAAQNAQGDYKAQEEAKSRWLQQFTVAFGTDEGGEATTFNGTIPQALMMMNGDLVAQALKTDAGSTLGKVVSSDMSAAQKINYLFTAGLSRKPNTKELTAANTLVTARKGNAGEALRDIWWAVLNSNEFILNH